MREDTAELASRALSDAVSIRTGTPPRQVTDSVNLYFDESSEHGLPFDTVESTYPEVIEEVSEPVSPESGRSTHNLVGNSVLAEMIRKSSLKKGDEETGEENSESSSASVHGVTMRNGIISQPHEGTPLLQGQASLENGGADMCTYLHDIESLKRSYPGWLIETRNLVTRSRRKGIEMTRALLSPKTWNVRFILQIAVMKPASYIPAIVLGLLLNILDALSYGIRSSKPHNRIRNS